MSTQNRSTEAFIDLINLALGGFLILSPWLFGFRSQVGWHTSWMAGTAIVVIALFSIADLFDSVSIPTMFESEEWINLTIGSWLAICPWILNFNDEFVRTTICPFSVHRDSCKLSGANAGHRPSRRARLREPPVAWAWLGELNPFRSRSCALSLAMRERSATATAMQSGLIYPFSSPGSA